MNDLKDRKEYMLNTMRDYKARGITLPFYVAAHSLIYENFDNNGGKNPIQIWAVNESSAENINGQIVKVRGNHYSFTLVKYKRSLTGKCKPIEKETLWRKAFNNGFTLQSSDSEDVLLKTPRDFNFFEDIIGEDEAEKAKETFYMFIKRGDIAVRL